MAFAVGIDLGTTNTVVACVRDGVAGTLPDPDGHRLLPSVVSFHPSGSTLVGRAALDRRLVDAPNTVYSIKRLMGLPWSSPEVQAARGKLPFELQEAEHGGAGVVARGERYSLPEISAFVLRHAKAVAEAALGPPVERAVVTVPANFNDLQRAATKTAGRLAGLEVLRILNEPTAAALAYGPPEKPEERVAVYDLGGGTFDVTLLDLSGNVFEVLSTAGDTKLGGDDIDLLLAERMADDLLKKHRFDARTQPAAFGQLRVLAERLKCDLSTREEQTIAVDDIVPGDRGSTTTWRFRMTRAELEWAVLALIERTFKVCQQAFDAASAKPGDIDRVILVGGATRMPMVARKVEQFFGRPPTVRINPDEVVALGAAIQAALLDRSRRKPTEARMAHPRIAQDSVLPPPPEPSMSESDPLLPVVDAFDDGSGGQGDPADEHGVHVDVAHMDLVHADVAHPDVFPADSLPMGLSDSVPRILPRAASKPLVFDVPELVRVPARAKKAPTTLRFGGPAAAAPPTRGSLPADTPSLPPGPPPIRTRPRAPTMPFPFEASASPDLPREDDPVAAPAPAHRPAFTAPLLIDVTPLSLCVETVSDFCDVLIEANTPVPCDRTRSFATASDGQTTVVVRVAQGKSARFSENTLLGELELSGIAPAQRGEVQVAVTFEIDADGILNVRARDVATGHGTAARIQLVGAQSGPGELEAMQARQAAHPLAPLGVR
jgi:molecular chaperone DnaK